MYRNVAGQKIRVYAYNVTTGLPVTGDAANITAVITKDDGTPASSNDTNPTEVDAVDEKGYYDFDLAQAETNAGKISFTAQSATTNVIVYTVGGPVIYTIASDILTAISSLSLKMRRYFQLALRKDSAVVTDLATEIGEINANTGSGAGSYNSTTDSQEAIADNGGGGGSVDEEAIATAVWANSERTLTQAVVIGTVPSNTDLLNIHCGDSYSYSFTGMGSIANRSKLWFTVKSELDDDDDDAILQITEAGGLIRVNGESPVSSSLASITVDNETSGNITIALDETLTRLLAVGELKFYDVQVLRSTGAVNTLIQGTLIANDDVTKAVS